ncbi:GNAT family N-acetyltransferase [Cohnella sp. REN36]|uniref:GNAT family N-acetyltransferase n=1 Tax=Cohnella sp. REN36 TaxID=2887347 RepID=UPI001D14EEF4|nr:GNAT family N-acetyltransferase [Cohnella sp. REN36]MCC3372657.1 GNAT family N-acetyltransferase [Cohnella sp. REN36]
MPIVLRPLRLPDDYAEIAALLNTYWSEPTSAGRLEEDDAKLYEVGHTYLDENGMLGGYDRTRRVAVDPAGRIVGYVWAWRAPWTEPGHLNFTLVAGEDVRGRGVGSMLLQHARAWGEALGAVKLVTEVWDDRPDDLRFAERRGFAVERHAFQSVLRLDRDLPESSAEDETLAALEREGLRYTTLAEEPGEESERKLHALYQETMFDIPGFTGEVPVFEEWRKWYLQPDGYAPEQVLIVADGERYVGVSNVIYKAATNGMYHEYTGVSRSHRGRRVGRALKLLARQLAKRRGADYIRTDNDSLNAPILRINRSMGYEPLRGSYRIVADLAAVPTQGHE